MMNVKHGSGYDANERGAAFILAMAKKIPMVAVLFALPAFADTYVLNQALSGAEIDWDALSSYSGTYQRPPAAGDTVEIPAGMVAKVDAGDGDWAFVNRLDRIVPRDGAVFEVNVSDSHDGAAVLSVPVTEFGLEDATDTGTLRKAGGGELELAGYGDVMDGADVCDYLLNLDVAGGDLRLYKSGTDENENFMFKDIHVSEGATLHICHVGETYCENLNGAGFVTLDNTSAEQHIFITGTGYSSYSGWMTGKIRIDMTAGRHDITCPTNTINTICFGGTVVCGFTRLGANNETSSSLGTGNFNMSSHSGIIYLGENPESSSKTVWIHSNVTLDGGAYGGLTFNGKIDTSGGASVLRLVTLAGSNDTACVIGGMMPGKADQKNVFYMRKTGTGKWRMADHENRGSLGVFDVEEGTLQFDSIAEKGFPCSLGYATNLFEKCIHDPYESGVPVYYAMVLGGEGTEGTLEYTGDTAAGCTTRPIAVRSRGRFKSSTAGYSLCDVYALGAGEKTLTLDSSAQTGYGCMATKLSDGFDGGTLSVVKEGDGVWQLSGTNTFTGSAVSRGGTLLINNPTNTKYKWYRFVVTENAYSCSRYDTVYSMGVDANGNPKAIPDTEKGYVQISSIALYDADGNNLVKNFTQKTPITQFAFVGGDARIMEPGEVALGQTGKYTGYTDVSQLLQNAFGTSGYPAAGRLPGADGGVKQNDQSTWLPIVVRLPDDAPAAVRVDFKCGRNREGVGSYNGRNMTAFRLDASADGLNWDEGIASNATVQVRETLGKWDSDGTSTSVTAIRKDLGTEISKAAADGIYSVNIYQFSSVGAANGGVLKVLGGAIEVSGLTIDASASAGSIENVTLAESGTIDVLNAELTDGAPFALPGDYSGLEGIGNVSSWALTVNGEPVPSMFVGVKDGKLSVFRRGLRVILR